MFGVFSVFRNFFNTNQIGTKIDKRDEKNINRKRNCCLSVYYSNEKILETIEWSAQLDKRDKDFSTFFLNSDMLHAV